MFYAPIIERQHASARDSDDADSQHSPIRILHSVGHLSRGGIENWLFQMVSHMDRSRFEHHVLVRTKAEEPFTRAFLDAGIPVIPIVSVKSPHTFYREFSLVLREHGPYDVLHAHGFSFLTIQALLFAKLQGIRVRMLHGHNDLRPKLAHARALYKAYVSVSLWAIQRLANAGAACSSMAAEWTFGPKWKTRKPPVELMIGIDLDPCFQPHDPDLRSRLGIPPDRFVIAQIGRYSPAKNHGFTVEIAAELARRKLPFHMLLIGAGAGRPGIKQRIIDAGLEDYCTWLSDSEEVPAILRSVVDLQILPSIHEGLGLVLVEAQAAGAPSLVSDTVTREGVIDPDLVQFLPIDRGSGVWADAIVQQLHSTVRPQIDAAHKQLMLASRFNIQRNVTQLSRIYQDLVRTHKKAKGN